MKVHAKPKMRGRRQSWMSKSPFPAFDPHSNGYPIFCLFPGCNVKPFWCSDALAYHYKVFHPKSDAICSAQPFEAPKHRARGSHPEGNAFLDNAQTVRATEHHYEEAGDVFICDYPTQTVNALVPSNDLHVFATTYVESMERRSRSDIETRSYAAEDTFDAIPALGKPPLARMENHVVAVSVRKLTRTNRTEALD